MDSIIQETKECYVCGTTQDLHSHHIFGGPNRKWSEAYGLKVWLCARDHNMSDAGVHFNKELDNQLKQIGQAAFEDTFINEDFLKIFGRNYL